MRILTFVILFGISSSAPLPDEHEPEVEAQAVEHEIYDWETETQHHKAVIMARLSEKVAVIGPTAILLDQMMASPEYQRKIAKEWEHGLTYEFSIGLLNDFYKHLPEVDEDGSIDKMVPKFNTKPHFVAHVLKDVVQQVLGSSDRDGVIEEMLEDADFFQRVEHEMASHFGTVRKEFILELLTEFRFKTQETKILAQGSSWHIGGLVALCVILTLCNILVLFCFRKDICLRFRGIQ